MSEYIVELKNISKSYQDGSSMNKVLDNVSLNVSEGEFIAIVGPSGSGKSTLLSIAGMMLSADEGEIKIAGEDYSKCKQKQWTKIRNKHIGFIFQTHQLLPFLKVKDQLAEFQNKENKAAVNTTELLENLGLGELMNKYPAKMSGGEKQRVAIARAFVNNPDVILADEPTASLDGVRGRQVVQMIREEVKAKNKAAIMVTHDERILDLVDTVYRLENGVLTKA